MDLSNNMLSGKISDFSSKPNLLVLDVSDNNFTGPIPHISSILMSLILRNNSFSGPISPICESLVANNSFSFLDLSDNVLSGPLPDCWKYGESLVVLNLANNNLSGLIPASIGCLIHLKALGLDMNSFSGSLPSSLKYLTDLFYINLGNNMLMEKYLPGSGKAFGEIPSRLSQLKHLLALDFMGNHLSGTIPMCADNFFAMARIDTEPSYVYNPYKIYTEYLPQALSMSKISYALPFTRVDLSMNQLSGEIPVELTRLVGLMILNLSHNNLSGAIPSTIGALKDLESLDLSGNKLSCSIPPEMADLTSLSYLNLSYNNLSGKIPSTTQIQGFDPSSFMKNEKLCGHPLKKACSDPLYEGPQCSIKTQQNMELKDQDHYELPSFYISMGIGFITAIWVYWTVLLLNESWREAYLKLLDKVVEQILVTAAVSGARLRTKLEKLVSR
ncbi:Non-specific serine/threonine protein kinase [Handroanthus impetiginosus]|uniref:Non-specific serine/threonine protein kinase n=1 Tax=Handroanthus impetiginosus TaxID=429701 RepID=A0A2G9I8C9_9LAMI|nr:Non-specific serine/threonine protein kinase [Handroanthus impetiginosus]